MKRFLATLIAFYATASFAAEEHRHELRHDQSGANPYAEMLGRDIKALSAQQVSDLQAGKGMGLSLPAELNGTPGPLHALQLADTLALSSEQKAKLQGIVDVMRTQAIGLGEQIIQTERQLDEGFKTRKLNSEAIDSQSRTIAELNGRLRAVHLKAHLQTAQVLTSAQIEGYNRTRGYAGVETVPAQ